MQKIKYLHNYQIDKTKWDYCINHSINKKVYALSWYLDIVSKNWGGLVYKDYQLVFPVVFKKLLFFKKVYQPPFCQQLGSFSFSQDLLENNTIINSILNFLHKNYYKFQFSVNHDVACYWSQYLCSSNFKYINRVNLELNLHKPYQDIFANYHINHKRNLKLSASQNFMIQSSKDISGFVHFYRRHIGNKLMLNNSAYFIMHSLIKKCFENNQGNLLSLSDHHNNLLGYVFFISYQNRDILLFNVSDKTKNNNTMLALIDYYIQNNHNKLIDFEGSNIPGVKRFYKGFGAIEKNYIHITK